MSEGELKKRLLKVGWLGDEFKGSYMAPKKDVWGVLDEAKKEFYKIINEDVPEDQNDPESLYELMKYAVEKWFGGYEK